MARFWLQSEWTKSPKNWQFESDNFDVYSPNFSSCTTHWPLGPGIHKSPQVSEKNARCWMSWKACLFTVKCCFSLCYVIFLKKFFTKVVEPIKCYRLIYSSWNRKTRHILLICRQFCGLKKTLVGPGRARTQNMIFEETKTSFSTYKFCGHWLDPTKMFRQLWSFVAKSSDLVNIYFLKSRIFFEISNFLP